MITPVGCPIDTLATTELYFEIFFSAPYSAMYPNVPILFCVCVDKCRNIDSSEWNRKSRFICIVVEWTPTLQPIAISFRSRWIFWYSYRIQMNEVFRQSMWLVNVVFPCCARAPLTRPIVYQRCMWNSPRCACPVERRVLNYHQTWMQFRTIICNGGFFLCVEENLKKNWENTHFQRVQVLCHFSGNSMWRHRCKRFCWLNYVKLSHQLTGHFQHRSSIQTSLYSPNVDRQSQNHLRYSISDIEYKEFSFFLTFVVCFEMNFTCSIAIARR